MAGVAEPDPERKLARNVDALREADAAGAIPIRGARPRQYVRSPVIPCTCRPTRS